MGLEGKASVCLRGFMQLAETTCLLCFYQTIWHNYVQLHFDLYTPVTNIFNHLVALLNDLKTEVFLKYSMITLIPLSFPYRAIPLQVPLLCHLIGVQTWESWEGGYAGTQVLFC